MSTIFSQIINRELPAEIIYEDDTCLAFKDINPKAPIHIMIIPKKEIISMATVTDADREILGHLMLKASKIAKDMGIEESGYRIVVNTNKDAGQSVYHLHLHLLGGRSMSWPPG